MDDKRKKLIDRIVKLFQLSSHKATGGQTGTTEAEMMMAVSKARQLMAEHQISMADVELLKGADTVSRMDARIRNVPVYTRGGTRLADYDWHVADTVATLTDTEMFQQQSLGRNRKNGRWSDLISVLFVGDEDDVALAGQLFHVLLTEVRRMARRQYGGGNTWNKQHTSYAVGVATRLRYRAREIIHLSKADQQTWGLILSSKRDAIERWKQRHVATDEKKKKRRRSDLDPVAYAMGYQDGVKVNLSTKIVKGEGS